MRLVGSPHPGSYFSCLRPEVTQFSENTAYFVYLLRMLVDPCPKRHTLIVLGDFSATTGTDKDGYGSRIGPHGSGSNDECSFTLLKFARSQRLMIAGSGLQKPDLHRWTWYTKQTFQAPSGSTLVLVE